MFSRVISLFHSLWDFLGRGFSPTKVNILYYPYREIWGSTYKRGTVLSDCVTITSPIHFGQSDATRTFQDILNRPLDRTPKEEQERWQAVGWQMCATIRVCFSKLSIVSHRQSCKLFTSWLHVQVECSICGIEQYVGNKQVLVGMCWSWMSGRIWFVWFCFGCARSRLTETSLEVTRAAENLRIQISAMKPLQGWNMFHLLHLSPYLICFEMGESWACLAVNLGGVGGEGRGEMSLSELIECPSLI